MDPRNPFPDIVICKRCTSRTAVEGYELCAMCRQNERRRGSNLYRKVQKNLEKDKKQQRIALACALAQLDDIKRKQEEIIRDRAILQAADAQVRLLATSVGYFLDENGVLRPIPTSPSPLSPQQNSYISHWNRLFDGSPPAGLVSPPSISVPSGNTSANPFVGRGAAAAPATNIPNRFPIGRVDALPPFRPPVPAPPPQPQPPANVNPQNNISRPPSVSLSEEPIIAEDDDDDIDIDEEELSHSIGRSLSITDDNSEAEKCTICLAALNDGPDLLSLPCSHRFHKECADFWFQHQMEDGGEGSCPLCRALI